MVSGVSAVGSSSTQSQIQQIMQQYGCTQAQAQQILNGQSPPDKESGAAGAEPPKGGGTHPAVTFTKTTTDPTTGQQKIDTKTANSKEEAQSLEAQGYTKQDNSSTIHNQQAAAASQGMAQVAMQKATT